MQLTNFKLNQDPEKLVQSHDYNLDPKVKYLINMSDEMLEQNMIMQAVPNMGLPALNDYHEWLTENGFDVNMPNPTNKAVAPYYGVKPLWKTSLSQGIVMKSYDKDDFFIVMECSPENVGFKFTQVVVNPGGCL
ncbi:hypothetical protein BHS03_00415 [Leuconostoc gasicomitatum]|uniref:hypothetical protein n=1 Tax=Leuconostoc gasicomitatum TaxID=115778 RepID=UPI00126654FA|nr:hypothetical protein [Leuconostoc gasicomitatum]QFS14223.1 hypothetical protein BHS03_00415 [Leuconostoc gasicomitatum]